MSNKFRYNLTDHLTTREVDDLMILFDKIKLDLSASSFPTRTNRLEAVENMKKVLGDPRITKYQNTQGRRNNVNKSKNRNNAEER